jgi:response regulator RpfG family c-di-GMP phosphodiesterase
MSESNEQERRQTILIVDDAAENLALMSSVLKA